MIRAVPPSGGNCAGDASIVTLVGTTASTGADGALGLGALSDPGRYRSLVHVQREPAGLATQGGIV